MSFASIFLVCICLWQIRKMGSIQKKFLTGKNGADLESLVLLLQQKIKNLENESLHASGEIKNLQKTLGFAVQKIGLIRYNPFEERQGGNYSFSLALLDSHNNGIILTNMFGRQQSRVYTKKLSDGKSETQLTEEENQAIHLANKQNIYKD